MLKRFEFVAMLAAGVTAFLKNLRAGWRAPEPRAPQMHSLHIGKNPSAGFRTVDGKAGDKLIIYVEGHGVVRREMLDKDELVKVAVVPVTSTRKLGECWRTYEFPDYSFLDGRDLYYQRELTVLVKSDHPNSDSWHLGQNSRLEVEDA